MLAFLCARKTDKCDQLWQGLKTFWVTEKTIIIIVVNIVVVIMY